MKLAKSIIFVLFLMSTVSSASAQPLEKVGPFSSFIMVHLEAGGDHNFKIFQDICKKELKDGYKIDNKSLNYQKALWPTVKELIREADRYNIKLTLVLNPQWAEYVLQDEQKIEDVRMWVGNGHELAFQHHGINHIDWNGYTNQSENEPEMNRQRFVDKLRTSDYRGNAEQGFGWIKKLASEISPNYRIMTGTVTDTAKDKPQEIILLTKGGEDFDRDFISKPTRQQIPGGQNIFWLRHYYFRSNFNTPRNPDVYNESQTFEKSEIELEKIKRTYTQAGNDEIVGVVFHDFYYYRAPKIYKEFFEYLASNKQRVTTVRALVKKYIDERSVEAMPIERPEQPQRPARRVR